MLANMANVKLGLGSCEASLCVCVVCCVSEKPRSLQGQQDDSDPAGLSGRKLPDHHHHLLLSVRVQRGRDKVHPHVRTEVEVHLLELS